MRLPTDMRAQNLAIVGAHLANLLRACPLPADGGATILALADKLRDDAETIASELRPKCPVASPARPSNRDNVIAFRRP